jgi:hypothetical protein
MMGDFCGSAWWFSGIGPQHSIRTDDPNSKDKGPYLVFSRCAIMGVICFSLPVSNTGILNPLTHFIEKIRPESKEIDMTEVNRVAFCGLNCWECLARQATAKDDWFARRELAAEWTTPDYPVMAEDINCEGCHSTGERIFIFCRECELRRCGITHGVGTCVECSEYPCAIIERSPADVRERLRILKT